MAFVPTAEFKDGTRADIKPIDPDEINRNFDAAMADDTPDEQAPPRRVPRTAPLSDEPKPRRGRPPKEEKSRTADTKAAAPVKDDYTGDAQQFVGGLWTVAASISVTQPYALILENSADALVQSLAEGAKHNSTIRAFVASGESSWMLGLASVTIGMGLQAWQMAKDPELRKQAAEITREHLRAAVGAPPLPVPEQETANVPAAA